MAPDDYTKFRAVGAVITKVNSPDSCMVVAILDGSQPIDVLDEQRWWEVDFLRTPGRAQIWADVCFDDRGIKSDGSAVNSVQWPHELKGIGVTSIGPLNDLQHGQNRGAVYVRDERFAQLKGLIGDPQGVFDWKPKDWFHYELTSVAYEVYGGGQDHRYVGFEGEVESLVGSVAVVKLYSRFHSNRTTPFATITIDLKDPAHCRLDVFPDLVSPKNWANPEDRSDTVGAREKMLEMKVGSRGGIYLNLKKAHSLQIVGPKLPIGD